MESACEELPLLVKAEDYENYVASSAKKLHNGRLIGISSGVITYLLFNRVNENLPIAGQIIPLIAGIGTAFFSYAFYHMSRHYGAPPLADKKIEHAYHQYVFGPESERAKHIEVIAEQIKYVTNPTAKQKMIVDVLMNRGEIDKALQAECNYLKLVKQFGRCEPWLDGFLTWLGNNINKRVDKRRARPANIQYQIGEAQAQYRHGHYRKGDKILEDVISQFPNYALELNVLAGNFAELYGQQQMAVSRYEKAVQILERRNDLKDIFRKVGEQRNESMQIKSGLVDGALYVKRGKDLTQEVRVNQLVYQALEEYAKHHGLSNEFICIARSLGFLENFHGYDYHFTQRRAMQNLEDILKEDLQHAEELFSAAIDHFARISALSTTSVNGEAKPYDYMSEFTRRVVGVNNERVGENQYLERFRDRFSESMRKIEPLQKEKQVLVHGDAGPTNVLGDGTIVDFEMACKADPTFDAVTIKERSLHEFTPDDVRYLIDCYNKYGIDSLSQHNLELLTMFNRAHAAICEYGTAIHRGKNERALQLLERSVDYLNLLEAGLGNSFRDYAMHSTNHVAAA